MSKLMEARALKRASIKRTALYNATGRRRGSIRYKHSRLKGQQHSSLATLIWYAINAFPKRK